MTKLQPRRRVHRYSMVKRISAAVATAIGLVALALPAHATTGTSVRLVVKLRSSSASSASTSATGAHNVAQVADDTVEVSVPNMTEQAAMRVLSSRSDVEWVEPVVTYHAALLPDDPCFVNTCSGVQQTNLSKINAPAAWDVATGEASTKVAILDSGIDTTHPDLRGRVTIGPNYSADANDLDEYGHGTHVAGILGAATNNGVGVAGVNWRASIVSVKVLDADGLGDSTSIARGLRWAAENGVRIVNLSLGGPYSKTMADAVAYAQARGVLVVAAADNQGSTTPVYPAALDDVLSVGASTQSDTLASFSNRGAWVDLLAPGTNVISTWPTNLDPADPYGVLQGTSMASPLVAGVAALLWSVRPNWSAAGISARILATTVPVAGSGTTVATGRLDAGAALSNLPVGYRFVASDGGVFSYGASFEGSAGSTKLTKPIVAAASPGRANGYWLVASDGGVFNYGEAAFYGSAGSVKLNKPIVAAAGTRSGRGYWLVASDGGVFSYGDAVFFGSTGNIKLAQPIVSIVPTVTGAGYWMFASDGGVFSYGDAQFFGSTGNIKLNKPIVAAGRSHSGAGYWLVASDGGVFNFGDAKFYGSAGALPLVKPIVSITPTPVGNGYWLVASDGGVFSYGDAVFLGSTGDTVLNQPIVAAAAS